MSSFALKGQYIIAQRQRLGKTKKENPKTRPEGAAYHQPESNATGL